MKMKIVIMNKEVKVMNENITKINWLITIYRTPLVNPLFIRVF